MRDWFGAVSAFGQEICVCQGGEARKCRAFIQPLSLTEPERDAYPTPAGMRDGRKYLIITAPDAFDGGGRAVIRCGERSFELLRWEKMGGGSHCEGIMRAKAGGCGA